MADYPKGTAYERSKQRAEQLALAAAAETGIELVIVNPAAVYGPGPGGDATSIEEALLRPLVEGRRGAVPMLPPGGMGMVYSTGLATGQLLAAERGVPGRALHPLRRAHELPRAGRDGGAPGRARARCRR